MSIKAINKCLIMGIGNYSRQDDGLGWEFLDLLQNNPIFSDYFKIEYRYQLQIEDADLLCQYDSVFFVDASKNSLNDGFLIKKVKPFNLNGFTSHSLSPETILFLSKQLFNHQPKAYIIEIEGFKWTLMNGLSINAKINLNNAFQYFIKFMNTKLKHNRKKEKI